MKIGEKVFADFTGHHGADDFRILTIERETPTRWVTSDGNQWYKKDLRRVGDKNNIWSPTVWLEELTDERQRDYESMMYTRKHKTLWRKFSDLKRPAHISFERLQEIYDELSAKENLPA